MCFFEKDSSIIPSNSEEMPANIASCSLGNGETRAASAIRGTSQSRSGRNEQTCSDSISLLMKREVSARRSQTHRRGSKILV